jgi:hypothetical protein
MWEALRALQDHHGPDDEHLDHMPVTPGLRRSQVPAQQRDHGKLLSCGFLRS